MIDLRKDKTLDLTTAECLKNEATYLFTDTVTNKQLIAKFIAHYNDEEDNYLIIEFKKIALLSAEPEIATVYFLVSGNYGAGAKSCYVMDFIKGQTLKSFIENSESIDSITAYEILQQLASGLEKAHHYEISHGDLHEENIMINNFGYVKVIDFLWWDFKHSFEHNSKEDLKSYKMIADAIAKKITCTEKNKFIHIQKYVSNIDSFKNVAKNIAILSQVSNELALIDDHSIQLLARIISLISPEATLSFTLHEKSGIIPEHYILEPCEKDKKYMEAEKSAIKVKLFDTRHKRIQKNLNRVFDFKLHQLQQAGFINWRMVVENTGDKFLGPYVFSCQIYFTYKLFEWKRLNQQFNFLAEPEGKSLDDLIFESDGFK
jgi:Protein kinase domain